MSGGPGRRTSRWYHDPVRPLDERGVLRLREPTDDDSRTSETGATRPDALRARVPPRGVRAGDLPAMARRRTCSRRTAPVRRRTPRLPPFVIIQPPPNVTGALHLGHAQRDAVEDLMIRHARMLGHGRRLAAGPRPRLDRRPVRARQDHRRRGGERATLGRERYLERMRAVHRRHPDGDPRPAAARRGSRRLGPRCGSRWTRCRRRAVREAFMRLYHEGPRVSGRGAHQLVPGVPDERVGPRGRSRRPKSDRCGRSATT